MRGRVMRGLAIIVAGPDVDRYRAALMLAAAQAAAGGDARIFLNERAVDLLAASVPDDDAALSAAGLPTLAQLQDEALGLGVQLIACQSGLAVAAIAAETLDPRIGVGGMVGIVTGLGEDRLVLA